MITLKEIAPYLAYKLQLQKISKGNFKCDPNKESIITWNTNDIDAIFSKRYHVISVKPILRNLSDLTKEIEVNGEKFVPIEKLFEIWARNKKPDYQDYYYNDCYNYVECSHPSTAEVLHISKYDVMQNPAWIVNKLFEWHFDVFGLIERGDAIDINTLKL